MLGTLSAFSIPLFAPRDEAAHYGYAAEVADGHLPNIETLVPVDGVPLLEAVMAQRDASRQTIWTANHPPLHYALLAIPIGIGRATGHELGATHAGRLMSVAFAAMAVGAIAWVVGLLFPRRPRLVVAAAGFAALAPALINTSASLYNDSLAILTSTLAFGAGLVWLRQGPSRNRLMLLVATCSLAAATRASGLLVVGVVGLAVVCGSFIHRPESADGETAGTPRTAARSALQLLGPAALVGVAVLVTSGWFYLRNIRLYGDFTATQYLLERFERESREPTLFHLTGSRFWISQQKRLWDVGHDPSTRKLWWLVFVPMAGLALRAARGIAQRVRQFGSVSVALADLRIHATRGPRTRFVAPAAWALGLLLVVVLEWSVAQFLSQGGGTHVRYVLPALALAAAVGAYAMAGFPGHRRGIPAVMFMVAMVGANLIGLHSQLLATVPGVQSESTFLFSLRHSGVRAADWCLVLVGVVVVVGIAAQAVALWSLGGLDDAADSTPA